MASNSSVVLLLPITSITLALKQIEFQTKLSRVVGLLELQALLLKTWTKQIWFTPQVHSSKNIRVSRVWLQALLDLARCHRDQVVQSRLKKEIYLIMIPVFRANVPIRLLRRSKGNKQNTWLWTKAGWDLLHQTLKWCSKISQEQAQAILVQTQQRTR